MIRLGKEKLFLKQGILAVAVMAGLYFLVLNPFLREGSNVLDEELERKQGEIKKYISRTGELPSKQGFTSLEKENKELKERFQSLMDFVDPEKVRISESTTEAGLYFIERLHSSMKRFSEEAASKGIGLPENLGFGDGLPKDTMVDTLLRQLETVELVVDRLLKSETTEISAIKPLKAIDYVGSLSKELLYIELPVQVSIRTDTRVLTNLLLDLKNQSPVISVKELHIKSAESEAKDIEVSLVLSTFKIARDRQ